MYEGNQTCTKELDALLSTIGESVAAIEEDPEQAYERTLARCLQAKLDQDQLPARSYGHRVVGNLMLSLERTLTRQDLDNLWRRIESFDTADR